MTQIAQIPVYFGKKVSAQMVEERKKVLDTTYFEFEGEIIKGRDVLKVLRNGSAKRLLNPLWLLGTAFVLGGKALRFCWFKNAAIIRHLPIQFSTSIDSNRSNLVNAINRALNDLKRVRLVKDGQNGWDENKNHTFWRALPAALGALSEDKKLKKHQAREAEKAKTEAERTKLMEQAKLAIEAKKKAEEAAKPAPVVATAGPAQDNKLLATRQMFQERVIQLETMSAEYTAFQQQMDSGLEQKGQSVEAKRAELVAKEAEVQAVLEQARQAENDDARNLSTDNALQLQQAAEVLRGDLARQTMEFETTTLYLRRHRYDIEQAQLKIAGEIQEMKTGIAQIDLLLPQQNLGQLGEAFEALKRKVVGGQQGHETMASHLRDVATQFHAKNTELAGLTAEVSARKKVEKAVLAQTVQAK